MSSTQFSLPMYDMPSPDSDRIKPEHLKGLSPVIVRTGPSSYAISVGVQNGLESDAPFTLSGMKILNAFAMYIRVAKSV
ncbi:hypothetical protein V3C99_008074 [Haemonchus contortus]|uniref:Uncharacterized protein n=1 Tax=Haemonchus contortus TaxID=6289 RepID=A0A7I4YMF4_HAECO